MYADAPIDVRKMIVAQLVKAVRVSEGYKLDMELSISERQLGLDLERTLTPKKRSSDLSR
jgi:hypothetical protein